MAVIRLVGDDESGMPEEYPTTLYVNGRRLITLQTTRISLGDWAYGFLFAEGLIAGPRDVLAMAVDPDTGEVWAEVRGAAVLTATASFMSAHPAPALPVTSDLQVSHAQLAAYQARMQRAAVLYAATGGMHVAALFRASDGAMLAREDVGRHNAVDKAIGAALLAGWNPRDLALLTSGRISYEMCRKAAQFGLGLVASRSAATDQAARLARQLGMDLIGYLRPHGMRVYTGGTHLLETAAMAGAFVSDPSHVAAFDLILGE